MLPFKQFRSNLEADLDFLGLSTKTSNALAESRISEETYAPLTESQSNELSYSEGESPYVAEHTLEKIEALIDTDALTEEDASDLIEGLLAKVPESGCEDLYNNVYESLQNVQDISESVELDEGNVFTALGTVLESVENGEATASECMRIFEALIDAPLSEDLDGIREDILEAIVMDEGFRTMLKKVKGVFKKMRVKKGTSSERAKGRQKYRKNRAKISRQRVKRGKKAIVKKASKMLQRARKKFGMESTEISQRLRDRALAESKGFRDESNLIERIGRVFQELTYHVSEDVVEVMEEQFDILRGSLCESQEDLELAVRPCVAVIAECMKEIEQGNC